MTGTGYVAPGDTAPEPPVEPWAALLPALDPSAMAWADRGFHLTADHRAALFDRVGQYRPHRVVERSRSSAAGPSARRARSSGGC